MTAHSIVSNASVFDDSYSPSVLVGRQNEVDKLRFAIAPMATRRPIRHLWIHGPPGTGKTCLVKALLNDMEDRHGIKGMYVNCWESDTFFSILDKIVRDFRILGTERLRTLYKLELFEKHLQGRPFLLVLDEIDKLSPTERNSIIYSLCGIPNIGMICICNSRYFYYVLDSRVQSRLDPLLLEFKAYTSEELAEILTQRAEEALRPEACHDEVIWKVAQLSQGDARVAIQTLRHAANYADVSAADRIQFEHVKGGLGIAKSAKRQYLLSKLPDHHQMLYGIIQNLGEIRSGDLWTEYLKRCKQAGLRSAASRTFSQYIKKLEELELVITTRALGIKGNVRIFRIRNG